MDKFFKNFEFIMKKICKIGFKGKFKNTTLFSVYASTEVTDEQ